MSEDKFVAVDGIRLWTTVQGSGTPLLLCNGGPGCCDYLGTIADMVDDLSRVIRFEQRGCGRSSRRGPFDVATCISDIEAIRKHYRIRQWIVGGHSWGADLALAYSLTHTTRTCGLLCISGGGIHTDEAWHEQYRRHRSEERTPAFAYPPNMTVNRKVSDSWKEFVRDPKLLSRIAELDTPALFLYGRKDIRPSWPVEQVSSLMRKGRFVMLDNTEHVIWLKRSDGVRRELRGFIGRIPA